MPRIGKILRDIATILAQLTQMNHRAPWPRSAASR